MKKTLIAMFFVIGIFTVSAQTKCYKYLYNMTSDGIKKPGAVVADLFYFTFNNDYSACYQTNKNGLYTLQRGYGEYRYVGRQNGMLIYKEQCGNYAFNFIPPSILYFSEDYRRMNWDCSAEKLGQNGDPGVRVFELVSPEQIRVPDKLY